jgi:hypothetical protein
VVVEAAAVAEEVVVAEVVEAAVAEEGVVEEEELAAELVIVQAKEVCKNNKLLGLLSIEIVPNIPGDRGRDGGRGSEGGRGSDGGAVRGYYERHGQDEDNQWNEAIEESPQQSSKSDNVIELLKYVFETLVKYVAKYVFVLA